MQSESKLAYRTLMILECCEYKSNIEMHFAIIANFLRMVADTFVVSLSLDNA